MPISINPLSPTQKAWLAGFIDGEGFIGITFQRKKENKQQSSTPLYHPFLVITNKNKASVFYIKDIVGEGRVYQLQKSTEKSSSPTFQYKLSKMSALADLLEEIKPYLKVKRKQSDLLLKYIETRRKKVVVTGAGSRGSTSFSVKEEEIYRQLLTLNKRG